MLFIFFKRANLEDQVILSKGHAAAALYTVLAEAGLLDKGALQTYYKDGTLLAGHPPCSRKIPAIPFGTGSLGHGLSLASGIALASRFTSKERKVFCILSDGDCNEGSTWEAALFAGHNSLSNLLVIVDYNRLQGFGRADEIMDLEPFDQKWRSFGFEVRTIADGHDLAQLEEGYQAAAAAAQGRPICLIAKTIKGHGVSYMEDRYEWHYLPMNDDQFAQALSEVSNEKKETSHA
jgi:transketolase